MLAWKYISVMLAVIPSIASMLLSLPDQHHVMNIQLLRNPKCALSCSLSVCGRHTNTCGKRERERDGWRERENVDTQDNTVYVVKLVKSSLLKMQRMVPQSFW